VIRTFALFAFDRSPSSGRKFYARRCYRPSALPYRCGLHLHEPNFDKRKEFDGEARNEPLVGAALWRASE
jgi:hypothetical protein